MILFDLKCRSDHVFEAWFHSGAAFESQSRAGKIVCPVCGDSGIAKAPMAPRLSSGRARAEERSRSLSDAPGGAVGELYDELATLQRRIEETCDYVGDRFPAEARRIHDGATEQRGIYGQASDDDVRALADEGIGVYRVPALRRGRDS